MNAHTPGPWTCDWRHALVMGANGRRVIVLNVGTNKDDADLIAAAPDLLAIAERALNESARVHPDFAEQIRAAIAKARGEV